MDWMSWYLEHEHTEVSATLNEITLTDRWVRLVFKLEDDLSHAYSGTDVAVLFPSGLAVEGRSKVRSGHLYVECDRPLKVAALARHLGKRRTVTVCDLIPF